NAHSVSVVGDLNQWNPQSHPMEKETDAGIWELFIEGLDEYSLYKFAILTKDGRILFKADPYAFHSDTKEKTASFTYRFEHKFSWTDDDWQKVKERQ
ncbi:1,4-alpha-glucan branching enzyme, partial [Robertmurraya sp. DFI.2.37]|nr:1,4-alpha-glucan branching enzyme [Robertmurraya sp. DFI.2.37]